MKFNHGRKVSPREIFSQRISLYNLSKVKRRGETTIGYFENEREGRKCEESNKVEQGFVYVEEKLFRKEEGKLLVEAWVKSTRVEIKFRGSDDIASHVSPYFITF